MSINLESIKSYVEFEKTSEFSSMQSYKIKKLKNATVEYFLKEIKLESKFFAILINGQKADLNYEMQSGDEVLILPRIAGGMEKII